MHEKRVGYYDTVYDICRIHQYIQYLQINVHYMNLRYIIKEIKRDHICSEANISKYANKFSCTLDFVSFTLK